MDKGWEGDGWIGGKGGHKVRRNRRITRQVVSLESEKAECKREKGGGFLA